MTRSRAQRQHRVEPKLERVRVLANDRVAEGVGPAWCCTRRDVARAVRPGQFVHLRDLAQGTDFLLAPPVLGAPLRGRADRAPLSGARRGNPRALAEKRRGAAMDLVGPLGHGWSAPDGVAHALLVAGGLGAAPLGMLAEELAARGHRGRGRARRAHRVSGSWRRGVFERVARRVESPPTTVARGSTGSSPRSPEALLLAEELRRRLHVRSRSRCSASSRRRRRRGVYCQVSLERLMACGIGACLSCVVSTVHGLRARVRRRPRLPTAEEVFGMRPKTRRGTRPSGGRHEYRSQDRHRRRALARSTSRVTFGSLSSCAIR